MSEPHETCDRCNTGYFFTRKTAIVYLFIEDMECNHIRATCPNCDNVETIYALADSILKVHEDLGARIIVSPRAPEPLKSRAAVAWAGLRPATEVEPPRQWIRQLYDDLRRFEREQ